MLHYVLWILGITFSIQIHWIFKLVNSHQSMRVQLFNIIHRSSKSCCGLLLTSGSAGIISRLRVRIIVSLVNGEMAACNCHRRDILSTCGHIAAVIILWYGSRSQYSYEMFKGGGTIYYPPGLKISSNSN